MAKKIPGTRVLDETFKQTVTAVAVPLNHPLALAFVDQIHDRRHLEWNAAQGL